MTPTRSTLVLAAALALSVGMARAQMLIDLVDISLGVGEQAPSGFAGVGARGMGMGGAQIAAANDGGALFWNPALLTRVRRMELMGGLGHYRSAPSATLGVLDPVSASTSASFTRLNSAVITAPYPAYRGGLTFAIGATRPIDYTYQSHREGTWSISGTPYRSDDLVSQDGGLVQYSMGMGVEISSSVALGATASWYSGSLSVRRALTLVEQGAASLPDSLYGVYRQNSDITGFSLTLGMSAQLPHSIHLGVVAKPPTTYRHDWAWGTAFEEAIGNSVNYYDFEQGFAPDYEIEGPWQLGVGVAWITYAVTVSGDVWLADWSQASFHGGEPYGGAGGISEDTYFRDYYDSPIRWHVGLEALLPWIATVARVGYYSNPDPFAGPVLSTGEAVTYTERAGYFTAGLGWLIDDTVTVDLAYTSGGDEYRAGTLTETRNSDHVFLTVGFRL